MKRYADVRACAVVVTLGILGFAHVAEADYLITLRNGKEITVRRYEEQGDQILYHRYGGKISISKTDVDAIKDLNTGKKRVFERSRRMRGQVLYLDIPPCLEDPVMKPRSASPFTLLRLLSRWFPLLVL